MKSRTHNLITVTRETSVVSTKMLEYSFPLRALFSPQLSLPMRKGTTWHYITFLRDSWESYGVLYRSWANIAYLLPPQENFTWVPNCSLGQMLRNGLLQCFGTFKMPILMFISILVFRPEGQIWNPVRRDTRIYVRRILNASRISKTQLNSCTISPS